MRAPHPGTGAALALALLVAAALAALGAAAGADVERSASGGYLYRILLTSSAQAGLSTAISLLLGTALALALSRRRFPGRDLVLAILGATAALPSIVVVFAVVAVYGRGGWWAWILTALGLPEPPSLFGWPGVLLAHVLLNAPLVARSLVEAFGESPAEHWRLAESLAFSPGQVFRHLDWPILQRRLPSLAGLVFLLCFTSFAVVLTLGGGPRLATPEVAIFEALRVDLDFGRAARLALGQVALCVTFAFLLHAGFRGPPVGFTLRAPVSRPDAADPRLRRIDAAVLGLAALLILPPLASVAVGLRALPVLLSEDVGVALATSLGVALVAAILACALALALGTSARAERLVAGRPSRAALVDALPMLVMAVPPFALVTGLYLLLRPVAEPALAGYVLLPLINALAALPFAHRFIAPVLMASEERHGRLCALLGLRGFDRLRLVDGPPLMRPLAAAFALAMALSLGDFGVVALFGGGALRTLPYLLYERLGAYRLDEAAAIGFLLVLVCVGLAYPAVRWSDAQG